MASTVKSGMVATESFFSRNPMTPTDSAKVFGVLNYALADDNHKPFIPFVGNNYENNEKVGIAGDQFFSSRLWKISGNNDKPIGKFEVISGKSKKGKGLKKAFAYYYIDSVKIEPDGDFGGKSTVLIDGTLQAGSDGLNIKGYASFAKSFSMNQTGKPILFEPDENGEGNVFFNGPVDIAESNIRFKTPTFFNDDAKIQKYSNDTVFYTNVGFNKNISTPSSDPLSVNGNIWVKEGFKPAEFVNGYATGGYVNDPTPTHNDTKFEGLGTNRTLHYTNSLPVYGPPCDYSNQNSFTTPGLCNVHGITLSQHFGHQSGPASMLTNINMAAESNLTTADILDNIGMNGEATAARTNLSNPNAAYNARIANEPFLSMDRIQRATNDNEGYGKKFLNLTELMKPCGTCAPLSSTDGAGVSFSNVTNWYTTYPQAQFPQYYYNDHLLIKVDTDISFNDASISSSNNTFNNKIIFWAEDKAINTPYYNSGDNASTLIYIGENGKISNFGTEGAFRGLIYMDPANEGNEHNFKWGANSSIDGAVLLRGSNAEINWNNSGSSSMTPITRNEELLKAFAGLTEGGVPSKNVAKKIGDIKLRPIGYYFY